MKFESNASVCNSSKWNTTDNLKHHPSCSCSIVVLKRHSSLRQIKWHDDPCTELSPSQLSNRLVSLLFIPLCKKSNAKKKSSNYEKETPLKLVLFISEAKNSKPEVSGSCKTLFKALERTGIQFDLIPPTTKNAYPPQ